MCAHEHRNDSPELYQISKVMHSAIKVFGASRNAHVVSNVDDCCVVDSKNKPAMQFHTKVETNIAYKFHFLAAR